MTPTNEEIYEFITSIKQGKSASAMKKIVASRFDITESDAQSYLWAYALS